jgi:hypothetical protein
MWTQCRAHLSEAGESYVEHFQFAGTVGLMLVAAGLACMLHAIVPAWCTKTASRTVGNLARLFEERGDLPDVVQESSGALTLVGLIVMALLPAALLSMHSSDSILPLLAAISALAIPAAYLLTNPQLEPVA